MAGDKRDNKRHAAITEVDYVHQGVKFHDRISDLSQGGFFIDSLHSFPEGSVISFQFSLPGDESESPITGEGRVAWKRRLQGMGIRFTQISGEDQERLRAFLSGK